MLLSLDTCSWGEWFTRGFFDCLASLVFDPVLDILVDVAKTLWDFFVDWVLLLTAKLLGVVAAAILTMIGMIWEQLPQTNPGQLDAVSWMQGELMSSGVVQGLVIAGILTSAIRIIFYTTRADGPGAGAKHLKELLQTLLTFVVVTGVVIGATGILLKAGDEYSQWILNQAYGGGSPAEQFKSLVNFNFEGEDYNPYIIIIMAVTAVIISCVQLALMFLRSAGLILIASTLPLAVGATNTEFGRTWFTNSMAYLTMLLLYKPAAATVYATAIYLSLGSGEEPGTDPNGVQVLTGITMMILSVVLMPAMMRLLAPASSK